MEQPSRGGEQGPKRRVGIPYIMPDGRSLGAALAAQEELRQPKPPRRRPGAVREPREGWTKPLPRAAAAAASAASGGSAAAGSGAASEAEAAELYALSRVGQRKQRRWLNDKLLRDMAGTLTAADMSSLFKPVPFGEARPSLWEQAAAPEHAVLWDLFRSLDMDKQGRVLQKWEAHVRELQAGPSAIRNPAIDAIAAWAGVSWKARAAMKRSTPASVQCIEAPILAFLQQEEEEELVLAGLEDGFHRLIAHGLAEFHSLASHSRPATDGGAKEVVMRRRQGAAAAATAQAAAAASSGSAAMAGDEEDEAGAAATQQEHDSTPAISCADILHVLVDEAATLTPQVLHNAYFNHSMDSSSEAGDNPQRHPHHDQQQQSLMVAAL